MVRRTTEREHPRHPATHRGRIICPPPLCLDKKSYRPPTRGVSIWHYVTLF
ncbi:hypothetical protein [Caudoviricetes sp.]|nr:hypothetical protein [Caudoviricetes sp.]